MAASNRSYLSALLGVAVVLGAGHAFAQEPRRDSASAEALFAEAKKKMDEGHFAEACPLLEESQRLDPGGGTLLNLAVCHAAEGKTASAWAEFQEALLIARNDRREDRAQLAEERIRALEPTLSRLTINVPAASDAAGLTIKIDSVSRAKVSWGRPLPIDPGTHTVSASAPGRKEWSGTVTVGPNADSASIEIPPLEQEAAPPRPPPVAPVTPESREEPASAGMAPRAVVGLAVAGAGVIAVGVGGYFGLRAIDKDDESQRNCLHGCTALGEKLNDQAKTAADTATAMAGIGLVAIGVGSVLYFTSRSSQPRPRPAASLVPTASTRSLGLFWRGEF